MQHTILPLVLTKDQAKYCEMMLNRLDRDPESEDVPLTLTANFGNGIEADIKLCNGDSPYVDAVLFDDGSEVHVLEVSDTIEGEYCFSYNDDDYIVCVEYESNLEAVKE